MPTGIYTRTPEMYTSRKGMISPLKGRSRPDMLGEKNPAKRIGSRIKIGDFFRGKTNWAKGSKKSPEWKEKIRLANLGQKRTIESRQKMSKVHIGLQSGINHPNWKGGISKNPYPSKFNSALKYKIRQRDNFTCCLCGKVERDELEELNRVLCVNHIDFDKNNCEENNLNTLCIRCNVKINRERDYWTNYFNTL